MSRRVPRPALVVPLAAALLVLAGCTPTDTATQRPDPEATTAVTLSTEHLEGIGTTGVPGAALPIPADARSLVVDFICEGGGEFAVELGDAMMLGQATFNGSCHGSSSLAWPVTAKTGHTLYVWVADGVAWAADAVFSTAEFAADPAVTSDCATLSPAVSALYNAEIGFAEAHIDAAEWSARMTAVAVGLYGFASSSTSTLAAPAAALEAIVRDPARVPGVVGERGAEPIAEIDRICDVNQSPLIIMGEFGG